MDGCVLGLFVFATLLGDLSTLVSPASAGPICRPALSITQTALSAMQLPSLERRWTATVATDASKCATRAGYFEIGVLREKENSVPLEFREQFIWMEPSSLVGIDVWVDEAVEHVWIDSIQPCPCADEHR